MQQAGDVAATWTDVEYVLVAARGSSDNAALYFQYLAGQELGLLVALAAPSLYEGAGVIGLKGAGVLAISQSGRSPGILEVLEQARAQNRPNAAITNDVTSPLAEASQTLIELGAGPERAIASTKTFSTTWHALAQVVAALQGGQLAGLDTLPDVVDRIAQWALDLTLPTSLLNAEGGLTIVGRGIGFAVAREISLKLREVAGVRAEAYAASDYLHGPIGADSTGSTLVLVVTEEITDSVCAELIEGSQQMGMRIVVVRPPERSALSCDVEVVLPESMPNWCLGLAQVIVGQVAALRIGELRQRPIDTPPGLNKITLSA